eukprot:gene20616-biopygen1050
MRHRPPLAPPRPPQRPADVLACGSLPPWAQSTVNLGELFFFHGQLPNLVKHIFWIRGMGRLSTGEYVAVRDEEVVDLDRPDADIDHIVADFDPHKDEEAEGGSARIQACSQKWTAAAGDAHLSPRAWQASGEEEEAWLSSSGHCGMCAMCHSLHEACVSEK